MPDPLEPIAAELEHLPIRALTVRRFRRSFKGSAQRVALWVLDELVCSDESGLDQGESEDPPGLEIVAQLVGGSARSMGELHPIPAEHVWIAQARAIRLAQRCGVMASFGGSGMLASSPEVYAPVHHRMRRVPSPHEVKVADPVAELRKSGWSISPDHRRCSLHRTEGPKPMFALLMTAVIVAWFVAVPLMFLTLLVPYMRRFWRDMVVGLWGAGTKRRHWQGHVEVAQGMLRTSQSRGLEVVTEEVALTEVFAVGRAFGGWSEPSSTPGKLVFWTDNGPLWFGPPAVDSNKGREQQPVVLAALEAWVWERLDESSALADGPRPPGSGDLRSPRYRP